MREGAFGLDRRLVGRWSCRTFQYSKKVARYMKFCVCIKQVPDVQANVQTGRMVLNAYDASAVEAALVLTESHGGEVDLVLIGPDSAKETVRKALAMGASSATHYVTDETLDSWAISGLLAHHVKSGDWDVVLTGKQSQDTDSGLTGSMLAERLGRVYATNAVGLELDGSTLVVTRQGDSGQEILSLPSPCLVTCSNDMNNPRIPSLKGIMAAKKKSIDTRTPGDVPDPRVVTGSVRPPTPREPGRLLEGEPVDMVKDLVARLRNEAGVLQ